MKLMLTENALKWRKCPLSSFNLPPHLHYSVGLCDIDLLSFVFFCSLLSLFLYDLSLNGPEE